MPLYSPQLTILVGKRIDSFSKKEKLKSENHAFVLLSKEKGDKV